MIFYTGAESNALREAVFGVMLLVSHADPGPVIQERYAGLQALKNLSPDLRNALHSSRVDLSGIAEAELEERVMEALRQSARVLAAKSPADAATFPAAVEAICHQVAEADGKVGEAEQAVIGRIRAALAE